MSERATVVVPCYNEADRLDLGALAQLAAAFESVILVDDGSTDATAHLLAGFVERHPNVDLLPLPTNVGKAEAVRAGLRRGVDAGASIVGYFDADAATPPAEMARLRSLLDDERVLVALASRVALLGHAIDRRPVRHYVGRLYATAASLALGITVYDTQCGAKWFRVTPALREALAEPFPDRWSFDVELLARLLHPATAAPVAPGSIVEMPLQRWSDVAGSKLRPTASLRSAVALLGVRRRVARRRAGWFSVTGGDGRGR